MHENGVKVAGHIQLLAKHFILKLMKKQLISKEICI
jgi:hypothetical protein